MKHFHKNTLVMISHKESLEHLFGRRPNIIAQDGQLQFGSLGYNRLSHHIQSRSYLELSTPIKKFNRLFEKQNINLHHDIRFRLSVTHNTQKNIEDKRIVLSFLPEGSYEIVAKIKDVKMK